MGRTDGSGKKDYLDRVSTTGLKLYKQVKIIFGTVWDDGVKVNDKKSVNVFDSFDDEAR